MRNESGEKERVNMMGVMKYRSADSKMIRRGNSGEHWNVGDQARRVQTIFKSVALSRKIKVFRVLIILISNNLETYESYC